MSRWMQWWADDAGHTVEHLLWYIIVGLGATAIAFGINSGQRNLGGQVRYGLWELGNR